jgi:nucleotide-binding universal stress UspA family protein
MSVFRRSPGAGSPVGAARKREVVVSDELLVPPRKDNGAILVAVDGKAQGWDALEWAAAEAAARQCSLRVVHVTNWSPPIVGGYMGTFVGEWDSGVLDAAKRVLEEAVRRALAVAPGLSVATRVQEGPAAAAVVSEGRHDALIVVGRGHKGGRISAFARSVSLQVVRHSIAPVVVVELFEKPRRGSSAQRVVVGVDCTSDPLAVLAFAFRAALRRGVGLTVLHASGKSRAPAELVDGLADTITPEWIDWHRALGICRRTFPDVNVRQRVVEGPVATALIAESVGAALVVMGSEERGRLHGMLSEPAGDNVVRMAQSPVAIVGCRQ